MTFTEMLIIKVSVRVTEMVSLRASLRVNIRVILGIVSVKVKGFRQRHCSQHGNFIHVINYH